MVRLILAALLALAFPSLAQAQELAGTWALRIDGANIFVFTIEASGDSAPRGSWFRPGSFASNGAVFARLNGSEEVTSQSGRAIAGDVELTFDDPRPNAQPDIFRFHLTGPGQAQLTYVGTPLAPFPLVKVADGARLGPFEFARIYDRDNAATVPPVAEPVTAAASSPAALPPPAAIAPPVPPPPAPTMVRAGPAVPAPAPPAAAPPAPPAEDAPEPERVDADFLDDL